MQPVIPILQMLLLTTPLEILVGLLRLLLFLLLFPIAILVRLWECLRELFELDTLFPEEAEEACPSLPESIVRRPDPCIYSQAALHAQDLPFTMVNPDISYVDPAQPAVLNPPLQEDKDYLVTVQVHNASTDPALGVRVGVAAFTGAAFAFIGPELTPLRELNIQGAELFQYVDVDALASAAVTFNWRTPRLDAQTPELPTGLRVKLFHPADTNPGNNLGIHSVIPASPNPGHVFPGEAVDLELPLFNPFKTATEFKIDANVYQIDTGETVELKLIKTRGFARRPSSYRLANLQPRLNPRRVGADPARTRRGTPGSFTWFVRPRLQVVKARYEGFGDLRQRILSRDYSLPPGLTVTTVGVDDVRGLILEPGERRTVTVRITTPSDATPGTEIPVNLVVTTAKGLLAGGVTVLLAFKGVE